MTIKFKGELERGMQAAVVTMCQQFVHLIHF